MNRYRQSFTILAEIKIRAVLMHALVTRTKNLFGTAIASCQMSRHILVATDKIVRLRELDKSMAGMMLISNTREGISIKSIKRDDHRREAIGTSVKIGAIQTFIAISANSRFTQIASSTVDHR